MGLEGPLEQLPSLQLLEKADSRRKWFLFESDLPRRRKERYSDRKYRYDIHQRLYGLTCHEVRSLDDLDGE